MLPIAQLFSERSKECARSRRKKENACLKELSDFLPLPPSAATSLDKASTIRLTNAYLKFRNLYPKGLGCEWGDSSNEVDYLIEHHEKQNPKDLSTHLMQSLDGFILVLDSDAKIIYLSENASVHLGISQLNVVGENMHPYIHPDDCETLESALKFQDELDLNPSIIELEQRRSFHLRMKCCLSKRNAGLLHEDYKVMHCTGYLKVSITYNHIPKDTEEKGEPQFQVRGLVSICHSLPAPTRSDIRLCPYLFALRLQLDFTITYADSNVLNLTGYEPNQLHGENFYTFVHPRHCLVLQKDHRAILFQNEVITEYYRFLTRNGGWIWLQSSFVIIDSTKSNESCIAAINVAISSQEYSSVDLVQKNCKKVPTLSHTNLMVAVKGSCANKIGSISDWSQQSNTSTCVCGATSQIVSSVSDISSREPTSRGKRLWVNNSLENASNEFRFLGGSHKCRKSKVFEFICCKKALFPEFQQLSVSNINRDIMSDNFYNSIMTFNNHFLTSTNYKLSENDIKYPSDSFVTIPSCPQTVSCAETSILLTQNIMPNASLYPPQRALIEDETAKCIKTFSGTISINPKIHPSANLSKTLISDSENHPAVFSMLLNPSSQNIENSSSTFKKESQVFSCGSEIKAYFISTLPITFESDISNSKETFALFQGNYTQPSISSMTKTIRGTPYLESNFNSIPSIRRKRKGSYNCNERDCVIAEHTSGKCRKTVRLSESKIYPSTSNQISKVAVAVVKDRMHLKNSLYLDSLCDNNVQYRARQKSSHELVQEWSLRKTLFREHSTNLTSDDHSEISTLEETVTLAFDALRHSDEQCGLPSSYDLQQDNICCDNGSLDSVYFEWERQSEYKTEFLPRIESPSSQAFNGNSKFSIRNIGEYMRIEASHENDWDSTISLALDSDVFSDIKFTKFDPDPETLVASFTSFDAKTREYCNKVLNVS